MVPAGSYVMGSPASEVRRLEWEEPHDHDEGPLHRVTIAYSFAVGVHEVTFDEWDACVAAGGCKGRFADDFGWVAGDGAGVPVVERVGMGVRGARGNDDGPALGRERVGTVPVRCYDVWPSGRGR